MELLQSTLYKYLNTNDNPVYKTRTPEQNDIKRFGIRTENFKQPFFFPFCVKVYVKGLP